MSTDDPRFNLEAKPWFPPAAPLPDDRLICVSKKCRARNPKTNARCLACGANPITPDMVELKRRLQSGNPQVAADDAQAELEEMRRAVAAEVIR